MLIKELQKKKIKKNDLQKSLEPVLDLRLK